MEEGHPRIFDYFFCQVVSRVWEDWSVALSTATLQTGLTFLSLLSKVKLQPVIKRCTFSCGEK